jgi:hypothetical protein
MYDNLIILFSDIFNQRVDEGKDGYFIIKFCVPLKVLCSVYERLKNVDVPPIESLPVEQKTKYWNIGKKYYESQENAILASKAAYIISLITNTT